MPWCVVLKIGMASVAWYLTLFKFHYGFQNFLGETFSDPHRGPRNLMGLHRYVVSTRPDELVIDPHLKKSWIRLCIY